MSEAALAGIGMTSRRTRLRLQAQLQAAGIDVEVGAPTEDTGA